MSGTTTTTLVASEGTIRTCATCGEDFLDPSPRHRRLYCFSCSPPRHVRGRKAHLTVVPEPQLPGAPFTVEHFAAWAERLELKRDEKFRLEIYQRRFLEDLFATDADGKKRFAELWLVVPEGCGKSTFIALVVLYTIRFLPEAWVPVAASARDQGMDITFRIARGLVERNKLDVQDRYRIHPGMRILAHAESRGAAKVFAAKPGSGDGVDPDLAVIEELHRFDELDLYDLWGGKLEKARRGGMGGQLVIVSTAGEPGGAFEERREQLRQEAVEITREGCFVRAVGHGIVLHEYAIPEDADPEDLEIVLAANPFSGTTIESLRQKRARTRTLAHWRRFTCNLPTRADEAAITEAEWFAQTALAPIPEGEPVGLGCDFAWNRDTTALVPLWERDASYRQWGPAAIIAPPGDGGQIHPDEVKRALYEIHARNPIAFAVMDMNYAKDIAAWISDEFGIVVVDRSQGNPSKIRDYECVMEGLRQRTLWHSGDEGLRRHALNAIARVLPNGKVRFARPKDSRTVSSEASKRRVIDALDAAAMVLSYVSDREEQPRYRVASFR